MNTIRKRDGSIVPFSISKITAAVCKAFFATGEIGAAELNNVSESISRAVVIQVDAQYPEPVWIEHIQNEVEKALMRHGFDITAKAYILYRAARERERDSRLMATLNDIARSDAKDSDTKRENANIDGNTAMGTMLKFGSESAKAYYKAYTLSDRARESHENGDIHIHDLDFLTLTTTCCQIDLTRLFENGFSTGHGYLREPQHIATYGALCAIVIQANQNDQHGGQSIPNFDRDMAPGVEKTFAKTYAYRLADALEDITDTIDQEDYIKQVLGDVEHAYGVKPSLAGGEYYDRLVSETLMMYSELSKGEARSVVAVARRRAIKETDRATYKAMVALVHNLNTMHSRAGAQVPFSSLNYGTDTSPEGRMVIKNILKATIAGLGRGETPIFPIQVFRLKKGVNMDSGDPNYDLFRLALECSAKRMFPNFSFQDAPFNIQYYKPGDPKTEIAYMGCRTRVIGNTNDKGKEISHSRGNLSFTTINLPKIAFQTHDMSKFYRLLDEKLELTAEQLLERYAIQASKKVYNYPFLMGQGVWLDSDKLKPYDTVGDVLKHGTLSIGFIGLAETLILLTGKHHGEDSNSQELGLEIIRYMREFCDRKSKETGMNFTLLATPAEGLSGRFIKLDRQLYGSVEGVTDKEYYTNSFHVPVSFPITACEKIRIEAPYHELTNAGHISYIEMDGDLSNNLDAFESVVRYMGECGIGYGAVNHPIDCDTECGYSGVIGDVCPKCGRAETPEMPFDRIRRITGYLVGTLDRFNNAKRAEERDRRKHSQYVLEGSVQ